MGEAGIIEMTQAALLSIAIVGFVVIARAHRAATTLRVLATLIAILLVRELDGAFDALLFHGAWKWPAAALLLFAIRYAWRRSRDLLRGARLQSTKFSTGLLLAAFAVILIGSRLLGMQTVWREILADGYAREVPRLIEELLELAGYALLVIAVIETYFETRFRVAPDRRQPAREEWMHRPAIE